MCKVEILACLKPIHKRTYYNGTDYNTLALHFIQKDMSSVCEGLQA